MQVATGWDDYKLIDSGNGEKLESWGGYTVIRPEPRAIWAKQKSGDWKQADAVFRNEVWEVKNRPPEEWKIEYMIQDPHSANSGQARFKIQFLLRTTDFKHTGVFPEQAGNWEWIIQKIKNSKNQKSKILNLFAYTGGATMVAAGAGAHVTHVDASRPAMMWASKNYKLSDLPIDRVRWIQDDALKFVQREQRRGVTYDGIIMDPPKFGRGSNGEIWKLEDNLAKLVHECKKILSDTPLLFLINAYTADLSHLAIKYVLEDALEDDRFEIESGELGIPESSSGRVLPAGIFARWSVED